MAEDGRPTVLINLEDLNDHWVEGNENGFGKQWDDWSFVWSGVQVNDDNLIKNRKTSMTSNSVSRFATITSQNKHELVLFQPNHQRQLNDQLEIVLSVFQ